MVVPDELDNLVRGMAAPTAPELRPVPRSYCTDWAGLATARALRWTPPLTRTVVVAPHPDDEVLGCGGLVAYQRRRGMPVTVVAVTDGEAAYPREQRAELRGTGLAERRRHEQETALEHLGVTADQVVRLGIPDGRVEENLDELCRLLDWVIEPGDLVVAPWVRDHHTDHVAAGRAALRSARRGGAEIVGWMFWAYHHTPPEEVGVHELLRFVLDDDLKARRARALEAHRSQLPGEAAVSILDPWSLAPLERGDELLVRYRC